MKRVWVAVAFLVLACAGGVAYQTLLLPARSQTASTVRRHSPAVPVVVATVVRKSMPVRIDTIGTVQPIANVVIKSRIDGYIDKVLIHDGQYVKGGDVMFRLDARAAQAQVLQAEASLAKDQAQLANAQRDVKRYASLVAKDFVSRQQYDTAVTTVQAFEAAVAVDQAAIQNAKVLLSYDTITAPIDGRVGAIAIKAGNSIKSNDLPLATINQIKPIYVGFALAQSELPALREAMARGPVAVTVVVPGDPGKPITGTVAFFDNSVDTASGTINVRARFANDDERLWPGLFLNVSVTTRDDPNAVVVPSTAVEVGQDGDYVFVVKPDNTVASRPVTVSRAIGGESVIAKGLAAGERVVVDGQLRLTTGTRIEIHPPVTGPKPVSAS
ncbi:MAG TPA: efflux RND transporter periplasmic adaptor subunit [Stellaceae bacterium]|nr:efflux RND transporter periplasmic adaptor subunit [Stellaceae bacterium]